MKILSILGITIGFEQTLYPTVEDSVNEVCAVIVNGTIERDVTVEVSSSDGSAIGMIITPLSACT